MGQLRTNKNVLLLLATFALTCSVHAQIQWSKQLTPDSGWAATSNQLFWTANGGSTWRDITPPQAPKGSTPLRGISAVFFLDSSMGWVVMFSYDEKLDTGANRIYIASTSDAGANWSYKNVSTSKISQYNSEGSSGLSGRAWLQFTDAQHGIMNLGPNTGSAFRRGAVSVITSDGGRTWTDTDPGGDAVSGELLFTTQNDGWIVGENGDGLFVTRNGGNTWRETAPPAPQKLAKETTVIYSLPIFSDKDHGFLAVAYQGLAGAEAVILFSSHDGGRTWRQDKLLPGSELPIQPLKNFTFLGSEWKEVVMKDHELALSSLKSSPASSAAVDANLEYLYSVTFLDGFHGWALMGVQGDGPDQLLSTSDGGASWTIITPPPIKGNVVGHRLASGPLRLTGNGPHLN